MYIYIYMYMYVHPILVTSLSFGLCVRVWVRDTEERAHIRAFYVYVYTPPCGCNWMYASMCVCIFGARAKRARDIQSDNDEFVRGPAARGVRAKRNRKQLGST